MSITTQTQTPYQSRGIFLVKDMHEVLLCAKLDWLVCQEPLTIALGNAEITPPQYPTGSVPSLLRVASINGEVEVCKDDDEVQSHDGTRTTFIDAAFDPVSNAHPSLQSHLWSHLPHNLVYHGQIELLFRINANRSSSQAATSCSFLRKPTYSMCLDSADHIGEGCVGLKTSEMIRNDLMSNLRRILTCQSAMEP
jgi:hypothetical protein